MNDDKKSKFADIVADNFYEIRDNFKRGLKGKGYEYDEDVLSDAFISCNLSLKDKYLTKEEAVKYYWTSYINKLKTKSSKPLNTVYISDISYDDDVFDQYKDIDVIDEQYNEDIDILYNYIMNKVVEKYGEYEARIFELHICQGIHTKDLIAMGYVDVNFEYLIKKIKRYIKTHVIKEDKFASSLLDNIFE
jgi:hypothetical protein